eukprot:UN27903
MQKPKDAKDICLEKPISNLADYPGPVCYAIPGNHDWVDGLKTFTTKILFGNWLGGWLLPQKRSYFYLKLPCDWYIIGLDYGLDSDIDLYQMEYFSNFVKTLDDNAKLIIVCHEPDWIVRQFYHEPCEKHSNAIYFIEQICGDKVRLRLAGDLHHYTRHVPKASVPNNFKVATAFSPTPNEMDFATSLELDSDLSDYKPSPSCSREDFSDDEHSKRRPENFLVPPSTSRNSSAPNEMKTSSSERTP